LAAGSETWVDVSREVPDWFVTSTVGVGTLVAVVVDTAGRADMADMEDMEDMADMEDMEDMVYKCIYTTGF
jgi:hypothetical protein